MEELEIIEECGAMFTKKYKNFRVSLYIIDVRRAGLKEYEDYRCLFECNKDGFESLDAARQFVEETFAKFPHYSFCREGVIYQRVDSLIGDNWKDVWNYSRVNIPVWLDNKKKSA